MPKAVRDIHTVKGVADVTRAKEHDVVKVLGDEGRKTGG